LQTYIELYIRAYRYTAHAHLKTRPFSDVLCFCYPADLMKSTKVTLLYQKKLTYYLCGIWIKKLISVPNQNMRLSWLNWLRSSRVPKWQNSNQKKTKQIDFYNSIFYVEAKVIKLFLWLKHLLIETNKYSNAHIL
jgi:hypothetical protein